MFDLQARVIANGLHQLLVFCRMLFKEHHAGRCGQQMLGESGRAWIITCAAPADDVQPRPNRLGRTVIEERKDAIQRFAALCRLCAIKVIPSASGVRFDV